MDLLQPEEIRDDSEFFNEALPIKGLDYFDSLPEEQKFDVVIIDEGQDFQELWILCLETMLKKMESCTLMRILIKIYFKAVWMNFAAVATFPSRS